MPPLINLEDFATEAAKDMGTPVLPDPKQLDGLARVAAEKMQEEFQKFEVNAQGLGVDYATLIGKGRALEATATELDPARNRGMGRLEDAHDELQRRGQGQDGMGKFLRANRAAIESLRNALDMMAAATEGYGYHLKRAGELFEAVDHAGSTSGGKLT